MKPVVLALGAFLMAGPARAEVVDAQPNGFESRFNVTVNAPPAAVRAAMLNIAGWWDPSHTYSGDAKNLSLDLAGGC
ncbi:MAG TPA: ATPase, partial [Phenylobacterium sp.]|nr:ATPase [Phenylobacterium sp.]